MVVLGSAAGAALLLATPPGVFQRVVPFLVGGASVAILVRRPARDTPGSGGPKPPESTTWLTVLGMFAVALKQRLLRRCLGSGDARPAAGHHVREPAPQQATP
ncbi:hypothetical protein [Streptomyces sp. WAC 06725]|uniref:hypothetical protein n=1 Tax=Streptomyces sp. WAC 06725 TaxID=2203209 RepID=UPI0021AE1781|nr:hypothetical protein [Streptomyces sp. WAC 06725]